MMNRRAFTGTALAALAAPTVLRAQQAFVLAPEFVPQVVRIRAEFAPGQILIVPAQHFLYFVTAPRKAIRYGVGVGKAGLEFKGRATIAVKKEWPTWRPTDAMIERNPSAYGRFKGNDDVQPGGPNNPLGARAMYLFQNGVNTYAAIHGTSNLSSIGQAASNGCFRMANEHVMDLYPRIPVGTPVSVL